MTIDTGKLTSHRCSGDVWRMEIGSMSSPDKCLPEILALEIRNTGEKQVSFDAIDLTTGKLYFKDLVTDERWLTGMETVFDSVLLLHYYQSESSPVHKGIVAVDVKTSATLWTNHNYSFDHLSVNGPVVFDNRLHPRKPLLVDVQNGLYYKNLDPTVDLPFQSAVKIPLPVPADAFHLPVLAQGNIAHLLEYNNLRVVSLHTFDEGGLQQKLYIFDDDKVVFSDLLNDKIQKMQPESFVLVNNSLIYLVNRSAIKILTL